MRSPRALTGTIAALGALVAAGQVAAATPDSVEAFMSYQEDYAGAPSFQYSETNTVMPVGWVSLYQDYGHGYSASNSNGILGAQAVAGGGGGGGEAAAMRGFSTFGLDEEDPGDPSGPVPTRVRTFSQATWHASVTNNALTPVDYTFIFHVYGPTLQTAVDSGEARVSLLITSTNASGSYAANASLAGTSLTADPKFGPWSFDAGSNSYRGDSFDAAVSLGTIGAGQTFTLTYVMSAEAIATDMEHGSLGYIGDPFNFDYGPEFQVITTAVPEPSTWALLLGGLGLVGVAARRRTAKAAAA